MSYTQIVRSYFNAAQLDVPAQVLAHLDGLDQALEMGLDVILSSDNVGCCEELTVVDAVKVNKFSERLNAVRSGDVNPGFDFPAPSLMLSLSVRDVDGLVVDAAPASVPVKLLESIVDVVADLALTHRNHQSVEEAISQLDADLVAADVIDAIAKNDSADPAEMYLAGDNVEVVVELSDDEPLNCLTFESAVLKSSGSSVLVSTSHLDKAAAVAFDICYPDADKYGVPDIAFQAEAEKYLSSLGLKPRHLDLTSTDSGDDGMICCKVTLLLPREAVYEGTTADATAYAEQHFGSNSKALPAGSAIDQVHVVNRFIAAMHGVES